MFHRGALVSFLLYSTVTIKPKLPYFANSGAIHINELKAVFYSIAMFDDIVAEGYSLAQRDWRLTALVASLVPFALTYTITSLLAFLAANNKGDSRSPPIAPYAVPFFGNLFAFLFDNERFVRNALGRYARDIPVQFRLANRKLTLISGTSNVLAMFRSSRYLDANEIIIIAVDNAFGGASVGRECYALDNTGSRKEPLPGSRPLKMSDRIWYLQHKTTHANLVGPPLVEIAERFVKCLGEELDRAIPPSQTDWVDVPDFYGLIQSTMFAASTNAIYGPHLIRLNPDLNKDFWEYDHHIPSLFKLVPRLFAPKAYAVRDRLVASVKKWHAHAAEHVDVKDPALEGVAWEEYYGSKMMRDRVVDYIGVANMTDDLRACLDVGLIWAANANIVPTVGWCLIDILTRPTLATTARAEIATLCPGEINMQPLLASPILQSIYAEELRLRNAIFIQRTPIIDTFKMGPWKFPKGDLIIVSSWQEARNRETWNQRGRDGEEHDVEEFWAERFLVYKDDPLSGPRLVDAAKVKKGGEEVDKVADGEASPPKFAPEKVAGQFIPYGGSENICPGRFYAKQEAMAGMALFLAKFEIELQIEPGRVLEPNKAQFGFGVMGPKGAIKARMRRRKVE
ncbi:hypothetical protein V497_09285 [Pseudogymnoascus sp. VKM F-4516 (FW-969)]|nr:hypothetical protein V497_09285 [Pseudogymnoascus sp. VKM F-4516 (FW-969)]